MAKRKTKAVEHSKKFETIKRYYDAGLWNAARVYAVVAKGWITPEEYTEITGQPYEEG